MLPDSCVLTLDLCAARKPPPATTNPLDIVFVSAEVAPWSKTGGLGDVMGALPQAMAERGHRVMVVSPRWGCTRLAVCAVKQGAEGQLERWLPAAAVAAKDSAWQRLC